MTITLNLTHEDDRWSQVCQATIPGGWRGRTNKLAVSVNGSPAWEQVYFGNTKQEVIDQVLADLKSRGVHGTLKVCYG